MENKEKVKYLIEYYKNSLSKLEFYNEENYEEYYTLLKKVDNFLGKYRKEDLGIFKQDFLELLNIVNLKFTFKLEKEYSEFSNINDVKDYYKKLKKINEVFLKDSFEKHYLKYFDDLFTSNKVNDFLNIDEKTLRLIENKLYKIFHNKNKGFEYLVDCFEKNEKINLSLAVCLALTFYKDNKHPAQIVTFKNESSFPGYYSRLDGNINIFFDKFEFYLNKSVALDTNNKNYNLLYNNELLLLIFHECMHFMMLCDNNDYKYENILYDISAKYDIDLIHDDFYLEYEANKRAISFLINFLKTKLKFSQSLYLIELLNNIYLDLERKHFGIKADVRTKNPHEKIYEDVFNIISSSNHNDKEKDLLLLKKNKYEQEKNDAVLDNYELSLSEIKKIILVVTLEYSKNHIYSKFNMNLVKDIAIMNIEELIRKYKAKEYQKRLQDLFEIICENVLYDDKFIKQSIMDLPMDYYLLDKVDYLLDSGNILVKC